jgi:hypothetical protein
MSNDRPRYLSYLLRLWQVKGQHGWNWQASLESPITGKRRGFQNLNDLMAFIQDQTQQEIPADDLISATYPKANDAKE